MPEFTVEISVDMEADNANHAWEKAHEQLVDGTVDPTSRVTAVFDEDGDRAL